MMKKTDHLFSYKEFVIRMLQALNSNARESSKRFEAVSRAQVLLLDLRGPLSTDIF